MKQKYIFSGQPALLMIFSILLGLGIWVGIVYSQGDPSAPSTLPGSNFQVCTGGVNQDACYNPSSSITRLNWTYSSTAYGQMAFWVQVDNNGDLNGNFSSPEINTGWINSSNQYYDILPGSLQPNTTYYWMVATADNHSSWSGWTCADASFTTPPNCTYSLAVTKSGTGSGTVTSGPAGINCGSDCSESYTSGTSVTLTASAASGSTFTGWSGEGCSGAGTCTVSMTQNRNVTATFNISAPSPNFSLNSSNNIYITILKEKTGESNTTNISITPLNGFNRPVTLSVQSVSPSLPSGSVVSFSPGGGTSQTLNSPYAGGSDFKVSIGPGLTSSQQYTLTVQGVDGGLINTTDVILNVLVKNPGWQEI